jgi:pimeloyl-ACP methyl ester carboxylesterase
MDYDPTRYDPSKEALYRPERRPPFGLYAKGDDWPLEAICAELARLAYVRFEEGDEQILSDAMSKAGFGTPRSFPQDGKGKGKPGSPGLLQRLLGFFGRRAGGPGFGWGAQAFGAVRDDGTIFVAFRGTQADSFMDLLADARFLPVEWPGGGKVHRGFRDTYQSLSEDIDRWVASLGQAPMVITGHSLGAAMATLMAAKYDEAILVTFGSPRVGDRAFADRLAGRDVRRYADCADMVAQVPPPLLGYVHVDGMRYIDRFGTAHSQAPDEAAQDEDQGEARRDYRTRHAGNPENVPTRRLADHAPINYISAVRGVRHDT